LAHPVQVAGNNVASIVQVRKWLERRRQHSKKDCYSWQRAAGLTEERRVELQQMIHAWRESHTVISQLITDTKHSEMKTDIARKTLYNKIQV